MRGAHLRYAPGPVPLRVLRDALLERYMSVRA